MFGPVLAVIGYVIPLLLVPFAFKAAGTLFNMAGKGAGKVGGLANSKIGAGSDGDKRRTAARQSKYADKSLNAKSGFGRSMYSKKAGFGYMPNATTQASMAGAVKKEESAKLALADRSLEGLDAAQLLASVKSGDPLTKRAAVARLAADGATPQLNEAMSHFSGGATNSEWQKAIAGQKKELAKTDPHLTMDSTSAQAAYEKMSADQVSGLTESGFKAWSGSNGASAPQKALISQQFASSTPLQSKTNDVRRQAMNASSNAVAGDSHYIPSSIELATTAAAQVVATTQAAATQAAAVTTNQAITNVYDSATSANNIHTVLSDPAHSASLPTGVTAAQVRDHALNNDLYRKTVEHAIITGAGSIPAPPAPLLVDPLTQGEVNIPGDDRSVS